jgi:hypothetical protein
MRSAMSVQDEVRKIEKAKEAAKHNTVITVVYIDPINRKVSLRGLEDDAVTCTPEAAALIVANSGFVAASTASMQIQRQVDGRLVYARPMGTAVYHPPTSQ